MPTDEDSTTGEKSKAEDAFQEFFKDRYDERIEALLDAYGEEDTESLVIDFRKLANDNERIAEGVISKPDLYFEAGQRALRNYYDDERLDEAHLRIINHGQEEDAVPIRDIRAKHMNKMVTLEGIVKTTSAVLPRTTTAYFQCKACGTPATVEQPINPNKMKFPYECSNEGCNRSGKNSFELNKRKSEKVDFQKLVLEEAPEELRGGQNPESIDVYVRGDIAGKVDPGNRVSITGILRADNSNEDNPVLSFFLEGNFIDTEEQEFEEIEISEEEEEEIKRVSQRDDLYDTIQASIAPSIFGYEQIKMAVAMQLFSGVTKDAPDKHIRGDIHNLLVGDPGTAKSEVIQSAKEIAPRGVYTVGKGSSAAGLTASAVQESDISGDKKWSLEAGALVLADKGLAAVDEIDKMRDEDRSALHEALEQQSYHPDTEVLLANGEKRKMGELVDELMDTGESDVTDAVNCEILDMEDGELRLHTVNLEDGTHEKIDVDRVSRHEAPDQMVEVTFSNGRTVVVTPEHPLYTTENGEISTMEAIEAEEGAFTPAPRELPNSSAAVSLETNDAGRTENIRLPEALTPDVAELLGHLIAEGHSFDTDGGYVIGYTNNDEQYRARFKQLARSAFGNINIDRNQSGDSAPTLRINSKKVYEWFEDNHPEVLELAGEKRIPASVLGASSEHIRRFLVGAFAGDESVESTAMGITTKSSGLAEDYADAMLKIGVGSRIVEYTTDEGTYYKTLVKGDSNSEFTEKVVKPSEKSASEAMEMSVEDSGKHHDVLPTDFIEVIRELRTTVGLPNNGSLHSNLENDYGIQVSTAEAHLDEIESEVERIEQRLEGVDSVRQLRELTGWSQAHLANEIGETASTVNYAEDGGYSDSKRRQLLQTAVSEVKAAMQDVTETIERIRTLSDLRYERITDVEVRDNTGNDRVDWVYDLTVEPTRTFVGKGVILHNTVSVNKAGINATLKSRCSLLAAANPKYGRFDEYKSVGEQIELEPALISRFDLIFTITDDPDQEEDEKLARHILESNTEAMEKTDEDDEEEVYDEALDPDFLRKYIAYARQNCKPKLTEDAKERIEQFYVEFRQQGDGDAPVPVTARAVQSMARLSEAVARMRLAEKVTVEDVERAISVKQRTLEDVGMDPVTGELDADMIESGTSKRQRDNIRDLEELIEDLTEEYKEEGGIPSDVLFEKADEELGQMEKEVENELDKLMSRGIVHEPSPSRYMYVSR